MKVSNEYEEFEFPIHPSVMRQQALEAQAAQKAREEAGKNDGIQLKFAKMLLKMSNDCKKEVDKYKGEIEDIQRKQKNAADKVSQARGYLKQCGDDKSKKVWMEGGLRQYFYDNKLQLGTEKDPVKFKDYYTKDQWEFNLKSLTNHQEQIGTETQTKMVFLQDFVGQYQANLTGAKTAIADFNDLLKKLL